MDTTTNHLRSHFGNKIRIRVCGIQIEGGKILLVKHTGLGPQGVFWAPPGGGVEFGESLTNALTREVLEETALTIKRHEFLFIHEFIDEPFHAIEVFFRIQTTSTDVELGKDPELQNQIIEEVKYFSELEIYSQNLDLFHQIFKISHSFDEILSLKGYLNG